MLCVIHSHILWQLSSWGRGIPQKSYTQGTWEYDDNQLMVHGFSPLNCQVPNPNARDKRNLSQVYGDEKSLVHQKSHYTSPRAAELGFLKIGIPQRAIIWGNHGKTMGKPWENHRKTMGKPWENHGKPKRVVTSCRQVPSWRRSSAPQSIGRLKWRPRAQFWWVDGDVDFRVRHVQPGFSVNYRIHVYIYI